VDSYRSKRAGQSLAPPFPAVEPFTVTARPLGVAFGRRLPRAASAAPQRARDISVDIRNATWEQAQLLLAGAEGVRPGSAQLVAAVCSPPASPTRVRRCESQPPQQRPRPASSGGGAVGFRCFGGADWLPRASTP
jgi:hypothetical protein